MEQAPSSPMLKFGPYLVLLAAGEIRKNGSRIRLQEKPLRVLALLAERQGQVVTREELKKRLWPEDTFVDFDTGLNTAVSKLRDALSDSAETPRYIETIPRRGYRFLSPVETVPPNGNGIISAAAVAPDTGSTSDPIGANAAVAQVLAAPRRLGLPMKLLFGSLVAIMLLALGVGWFWFKGRLIAPRKVFSERQLTHSLSDNPTFYAEISPDGKYLAFADDKGLHLSAIESGDSHEIALPEELRTTLRNVTWFPDGEKLIIETKSESEGAVLWAISVFGGAPRKLRAGSSDAKVSPDGLSIAFISAHGREIWLSGANGENARKILGLDQVSVRYRSLAWSPKGQRLAYLKEFEKGSVSENFGGTIETLSLDGGSPSVVVSDSGMLLWANTLWLLDGRLIYSSLGGNPLIGGEISLWSIGTDFRTGLPSGRPAKMFSWSGIIPYSPSVSRDRRRLVVEKLHEWNNGYVGELKDGGTRLGSAKPLTSIDGHEIPFGWAQDSETVLVMSDLMGRFQIGKQRLDSDTPELLANGPDDQLMPAFTPDAAWILYWSVSHEAASHVKSQRLMRVPASGGSPEQLLETPVDPMIAFRCPSAPRSSCIISRSEPGLLIFYFLDPLGGQGKEVIRTKLGQANDLEWGISPDGSHIAIGSGVQLREQVRLFDLKNGTEQNLNLPKGWVIRAGLSWAADGNALFLGGTSNAHLIARIGLDGTTQILVERKNGWVGAPFSSPDGRHLAYFQQTSESNAWLLENF